MTRRQLAVLLGWAAVLGSRAEPAFAQSEAAKIRVYEVFKGARLVLTTKDFLPCQVWYHQPNGNEVRWDFKVDPTAKIPATAFAPPTQLDKGWRWERAPPPGSVQPAVAVPKK